MLGPPSPLLTKRLQKVLSLGPQSPTSAPLRATQAAQSMADIGATNGSILAPQSPRLHRPVLPQEVPAPQSPILVQSPMKSVQSPMKSTLPQDHHSGNFAYSYFCRSPSSGMWSLPVLARF